MNATDGLVKKARQGDVKAFEELVVLYQDRVYGHCCYLTGDPVEAQDLAQEAFVQAYRGIASFRLEADFGTWLHRITVNTWINHQRRRKNVIAFSLDEPVETEDGELGREIAASDDGPEEHAELVEFRETLYQALQRIKPEFRAALVLREIEGYNYDEIAAMLDCSLGTVKSRINRGRKALRSELEKFGYGENNP